MDAVFDKDKYRIGNFSIGEELAVAAGPCSLESLELGIEVAQTMKHLCRERGLPYVFEASFNKANRTSIHAWRGPGLEKGLEQLETIKGTAAAPILPDIHESYQVEPVFNCSLIPYPRNKPRLPVYCHIGLYAYTADFLRLYAALPMTPLAEAESLEQLKALEHGHRLRVKVTASSAEGVGVDTQEDLERVRVILRSRSGV